MIQLQQLHELFQEISKRIHEKRDELCELDGFAGDGDHGISMDIGFAAACAVSPDEFTDIGEYLKVCAKSFIQAVGASIGPLYGTAFLRAAKYATGKSALSAEDCVQMIQLGVAGMQERGKAQLGDKTLLDTLLPFAQTLRDSMDAQGSWADKVKTAMQEAHAGMESTREMVANIGRSSRLGERSRGGVDPGAASAYVVLQAGADLVSLRVGEFAG
ncbi:dihydroxyacetone kinase subunit DhaL [Alicyclobacillus fastidiosus]|uniref:Dihydroxyacetone kinase subunit DhaL n=1 Tax=Alicyclobacillus fastidiosus TaxID=392011 RepID=A0ABY6ZEF3_9BACL|nr:dihydroxyacetone kinase subunit DhaL [Alicyclobacillus fastidiosus]WAH41222.1 dihydroxyacetone kinase subunit DhaL [Alicyclobacillus fastidiosus]GMA62809.1 dihydroxyacetone kinase subunit L [Alicyclobacillus fastidiosus]